jgi:hypothetical protein
MQSRSGQVLGSPHTLHLICLIVERFKGSHYSYHLTSQWYERNRQIPLLMYFLWKIYLYFCKVVTSNKILGYTVRYETHTSWWESAHAKPYKTWILDEEQSDNDPDIEVLVFWEPMNQDFHLSTSVAHHLILQVKQNWIVKRHICLKKSWSP